MKRLQNGSANDLHPVILKPQDVALVLKILAKKINQTQSIRERGRRDEDQSLSRRNWTLSQLAEETCLSIGEIHNSLRRLRAVRFLDSEDGRLRPHALEEFLLHGVQYVFPAARGAIARGIPTAFSAPMLKNKFLSSGQESLVWPHIQGTVRGIASSPLYAAAPDAALLDPIYYELLALTDALRGDSRARERAEAAALLRAYIHSNEERDLHD
ncbi:MAG: hypothetical protein V4671_07510 [Armatimonadota bacterium]